jgi:hypothetical protein
VEALEKNDREAAARLALMLIEQMQRDNALPMSDELFGRTVRVYLQAMRLP